MFVTRPQIDLLPSASGARLRRRSGPAPSRAFEGISPAFNEILPAWVLSDHAYALARNEAKFRDRNRARRLEVAFEVLRPDTMDLVKQARQRLAAECQADVGRHRGHADTRNQHAQRAAGESFEQVAARE